MTKIRFFVDTKYIQFDKSKNLDGKSFPLSDSLRELLDLGGKDTLKHDKNKSNALISVEGMEAIYQYSYDKYVKYSSPKHNDLLEKPFFDDGAAASALGEFLRTQSYRCLFSAEDFESFGKRIEEISKEVKQLNVTPKEAQKIKAERQLELYHSKAKEHLLNFYQIKDEGAKNFVILGLLQSEIAAHFWVEYALLETLLATLNIRVGGGDSTLKFQKDDNDSSNLWVVYERSVITPDKIHVGKLYARLKINLGKDAKSIEYDEQYLELDDTELKKDEKFEGKLQAAQEKYPKLFSNQSPIKVVTVSAVNENINSKILIPESKQEITESAELPVPVDESVVNQNKRDPDVEESITDTATLKTLPLIKEALAKKDAGLVEFSDGVYLQPSSELQSKFESVHVDSRDILEFFTKFIFPGQNVVIGGRAHEWDITNVSSTNADGHKVIDLSWQPALFLPEVFRDSSTADLKGFIKAKFIFKEGFGYKIDSIQSNNLVVKKIMRGEDVSFGNFDFVSWGLGNRFSKAANKDTPVKDNTLVIKGWKGIDAEEKWSEVALHPVVTALGPLAKGPNIKIHIDPSFLDPEIIENHEAIIPVGTVDTKDTFQQTAAQREFFSKNLEHDEIARDINLANIVLQELCLEIVAKHKKSDTELAALVNDSVDELTRSLSYNFLFNNYDKKLIELENKKQKTGNKSINNPALIEDYNAAFSNLRDNLALECQVHDVALQNLVIGTFLQGEGQPILHIFIRILNRLSSLMTGFVFIKSAEKVVITSDGDGGVFANIHMKGDAIVDSVSVKNVAELKFKLHISKTKKVSMEGVIELLPYKTLQEKFDELLTKNRQKFVQLQSMGPNEYRFSPPVNPIFSTLRTVKKQFPTFAEGIIDKAMRDGLITSQVEGYFTPTPFPEISLEINEDINDGKQEEEVQVAKEPVKVIMALKAIAKDDASDAIILRSKFGLVKYSNLTSGDFDDTVQKFVAKNNDAGFTKVNELLSVLSYAFELTGVQQELQPDQQLFLTLVRIKHAFGQIGSFRETLRETLNDDKSLMEHPLNKLYKESQEFLRENASVLNKALYFSENNDNLATLKGLFSTENLQPQNNSPKLDIDAVLQKVHATFLPNQGLLDAKPGFFDFAAKNRKVEESIKYELKEHVNAPKDSQGNPEGLLGMGFFNRLDLLKKATPNPLKFWRWDERARYQKMEKDFYLLCVMKSFAEGKLGEISLLTELNLLLTEHTHSRAERTQLQTFINALKEQYVRNETSIESAASLEDGYKKRAQNIIGSYDKFLVKLGIVEPVKPQREVPAEEQIHDRVLRAANSKIEKAKTVNEAVEELVKATAPFIKPFNR